MKINWGLKIILAFIIFTSGIIVIVIMSMSANVDLVHEKYYEQEINYQKQIDILEKSKIINTNLEIAEEGENIILYFNEKRNYKNLSGMINFYRSSDATKDYSVNLNLDDSGRQVIPKKNMLNGLWKLKIELTGEGENYFVEKNIFLN